MSVLYLHTAPKPRLPGTDAVFQETDLLRDRFGGKEVVLFPFLNPSSYLPRFAYGWHKFLEIKRSQEEVQLNHIFSPGLFHFPILKILSKPVIYSITASIRESEMLTNLNRFSALDKIVVSSQRDFEKLRHKGLGNLALVHPGVNVGQLKPSHFPSGEKLVLLMASAPWESSQFDTKGVDLLLEVVKKMPDLRLILLWRGLMLSDLLNRIKICGVEDQVEVVNQKVDIQEIMNRVHATVLIAKSGELVKSFPHSLVESLACAKPVIISDTIAMADCIREKHCGLVLDRISIDNLLAIIHRLRQEYLLLRDNAERVGAIDFSMTRMLEQISAIYHEFIPK